MNCAQIKEQLLDFLYDELSATDRAAFAEHLRGCSACNTELASYQKTLGQTRTALAGPLMQDPPARVHRAVLAAAQAAARPERRVAVKDKSHQPGFFAWLWRAPWFLPACGAVSVATVVFLVRVLKNPEVLPGLRPQSVGESAPAVGVFPPSPVAAEPAMAAKDKAKAGGSSEGLFGLRAAPGIRGKKSGSGIAAAPTQEVLPRKLADDPLEHLDLGQAQTARGAARRFAEPPPPRPARIAPRQQLDDLLGEIGNKGGASAPPAPEDYRPLIAPKTASSPAPAGAAAPMPAFSAPQPTAAPSGPAKTAKAKIEAEEAEGQASAYDVESMAKTRMRDKKEVVQHEGKSAPSLDESIKKADRLFAAQDWTAAAAAYRDLLDRFPTYKDAPKWRERLNASAVAERERHKPPLIKKAVSNDALDGLKE